MAGNSPSVTSNRIDDLYSHIIDIADTPNSILRFEKEINGFLQHTNEDTNLNDGMGRIIAHILVSPLPAALDRFLRTKTELRATRIHLAVQLYRKDHNGGVPENLNVLVPNYLSEVPKDPFMENSDMSYRASNGVWTVYSVGPDQKDDHGNFNYSTNRYDQVDFCYPSDEYQRKLQKFRDFR